MERGINQEVKETILKEFIRNGYSVERGVRVWNIANSQLLYLTSEQIEIHKELAKEPLQRKDAEQERHLFIDNFEDIKKSVGNEGFNLVVLGGGSKRLFPLIKKLKGLKLPFRYCPVDSSAFSLKKSFDTFRAEFPKLQIKALIANFFNLSKVLNELKIGRYKRNIFYFGWSTFGNFEPTEILYNIRQLMKEDDLLLLTSAIHHPKWVDKLKKYPVKGTLINFLRKPLDILGLSEKKLRPSFRFANNRSEAVYTLKENKTFKYKGSLIKLRKGDRIMTSVSYKHKKEDLMTYLHMQFSTIEAYESKDKLSLLAVCKK